MGWTPFPLPADQHRQVLNAAQPLTSGRHSPAHIDGLFAAVGIQARYDLDSNVTDINVGTLDRRAIALLEVCEPHVDPDAAPFGPHVQNCAATLFGRHIPSPAAVASDTLTGPQRAALDRLAKAHIRWLNSTVVDRRGELRWNVPTGSAWSSQDTATRARARTVHTGARSSVAAPVLRRLEHRGLAVPSPGCGWAITHAGLDTWLQNARPDRARAIA